MATSWVIAAHLGLFVLEWVKVLSDGQEVSLALWRSSACSAAVCTDLNITLGVLLMLIFISLALQIHSLHLLVPKWRFLLGLENFETETLHQIDAKVIERSKFAFGLSVALALMGISFFLLHLTDSSLSGVAQISLGLYAYLYLVGVSTAQCWHRCSLLHELQSKSDHTTFDPALLI